MAKTYKDRKGYLGNVKIRRGCNVHGKKDCKYCMGRLVISTTRIAVKANDEVTDTLD